MKIDPKIPEKYKKNLVAGEVFTFCKCTEIYPIDGGGFLPIQEEFWIKVTLNGEVLFKHRYITRSGISIGDDEKEFTTKLKSGTYVVEYRYYQQAPEEPVSADYENGATFLLVAVENYHPLKKWTITDVINRLFDVAEPIRKGEAPRFRLNAEQAKLFDNILAPQFSFTKQTLRECLQEVGKVVHGEPRLTVVKENGAWIYELVYDMYGGMERSRISYKKWLLETLSSNVDNYATHLDSSAENLVNTQDSAAGVIVEPFARGYKSVRTEQQYIRITDENMIIATQYPIYSVEKVECLTPDERTAEITPYVFERSVYNARLSAYAQTYPYAKSHALMYTQGEKNITALNFKSEAENPIFPAYTNYAIVNILQDALKDPKFAISKDKKTGVSAYPTLAFRVTYVPIYNARVEQSKINYKDFPRAAAQIYNQMANIIESKYYGENLKGAIARIGNVERSRTYRLAKLTDIPKPGQLYNDDYYIASVSTEYLPTYLMCTIGLSKDFNRLSRYIGIPAERRFSEVSETQASERNVLYREYIVVGDEEEPDADSLIGYRLLNSIVNEFQLSGLSSSAPNPVTNVVAWGETYQGGKLNVVQLPVVSSAFGNSISFSWAYKDNFSAGDTSEFGEYEAGISGYFQNDDCYTDYYGKIYYYHFDLQTKGSMTDGDTHGLSLPKGKEPTASGAYFSTVGKSPYILRKDNREILQVNVQIDFVTNRKNFIIGSALAAYCGAVRGMEKVPGAQLYVFDEPLNKFIDRVSGTLDLSHGKRELSLLIDETYSSGTAVKISAGTFQNSGKAWAIVIAPSEETETVEDEQGNVFEQKKMKGGEVLLAQNMDIEAGDTFAPVYFTPKRKIYDETVWKDRR